MKKLLDYCSTSRQREIVSTIIKEGSQRKAARVLNIAPQTVNNIINRLKVKLGAKDVTEHYEGNIPDGFAIKGTSTLTKTPDGEPQWVKTDRDLVEQQRVMKIALEEFKAELPSYPAVKLSKTARSEKLISQYTLTDYHLGMLAWPEETGSDWDTQIAEELLIKWFTMAITLGPDTKYAVLANIGDFLHWDGMDAVTPANRHVLDADTRFQLLIRTAIRVIRQMVKLLLAKHEFLHIVMAEGNHDPATSAVMREFLPVVYEDEPRVTVDSSPKVFYCHKFGDVSLFYHHGHKRTVKNVDQVFAAMFREEYGATKFSYAHLGHLHHDKVIESPLMTVTQHRTMASPDAYAIRGGWLSGRSASVITYHKDYGKVGELVITPEMCGD